MTIAVIGLGYVGLPLVIEFGKQTRTIGFGASISKRVVNLLPWVDLPQADGIIVAAAHNEYVNMPLPQLLLGKVAHGGGFIDVKSNSIRRRLKKRG